MNRMTDGITNYGALPGSIYDPPPEESETVFVPLEFAGHFLLTRNTRLFATRHRQTVVHMILRRHRP